MPHPVYPFKDVLRSLRREAGLSILGAAEAVDYVKYERWEAGKIKVGARYVGSIAAAFGVTDELWALLYAWLVDHYTPQWGERRIDLDQADVEKILSQFPQDVMLAEESKELGIPPHRHAAFAVLALCSGCSRLDRLELRPQRRDRLPLRHPGQSPLAAAYGDLADEAIRLAGRAALAAVHAGDRSELRALHVHLAPLLTSPRAWDLLAEEVDEPFAGELRHAANATARVRHGLAVVLEAARGAPPTDEELDRFAVEMFTGDHDRVEEVMSAALNRGALPRYDPEPMRDLGGGSLRMIERMEKEVRQEVDRCLDQFGLPELFIVMEAIRSVRAA